MASTYTTSLKIQQIGTGEQSGIWGNTTNTNWTLIEQAVAGVSTINMGNANYTLSNLNGVSDEARNMVIVATGTNSGIRQIVAPLVPKTYVVSNQTTGGYAVTIGGSSGATVSIPNSYVGTVYCDGTNFYSAQTTSAGNFSVTGNLAVVGTTALSGALTGTSGAFSGAVSVASLNSASLAVVVSPNSGSTGAVQMRDAAGNPNSVYLQATNNAGSSQYASLLFGSTGTITASGQFTATQFNGAGTGLTGTAASLSIGGNAATATSAATLTGNWTSMPAGTVVLFYQTSAPTGWTQVTTQDDAALRIVSGVGGTSGGTVGFTTAFASQAVSGSVSIATATGTVGGTAITTAQLPAHSHGVTDPTHVHGITDPGHVHLEQLSGTPGGQSYARSGGSSGPNVYTFAAVTGISVNAASTGISIQNTGSDQTHTHSLTMNAQTGTFTGTAINLAVKYINVIMCSKN